ncbi:MAG TPA: sulfotransferase family 2 domain-containing protein, partial [Actinomycetota bacterium]
HTARRIELASRHSFEGWVERTFRLGGVRSRVVRRYRSPGHLYQGYIDGADFLMRYERLQDDFDQALRHVGIDRPIEIPQTNVTAGRHPDHRSYYTPRARAIVEKVFEPDLERFGYSF